MTLTATMMTLWSDLVASLTVGMDRLSTREAPNARPLAALDACG